MNPETFQGWMAYKSAEEKAVNGSPYWIVKVRVNSGFDFR